MIAQVTCPVVLVHRLQAAKLTLADSPHDLTMATARHLCKHLLTQTSCRVSPTVKRKVSAGTLWFRGQHSYMEQSHASRQSGNIILFILLLAGSTLLWMVPAHISL